MNQKVKLCITIGVLVLALICASLAYKWADPKPPINSDPSETPETTTPDTSAPSADLLAPDFTIYNTAGEAVKLSDFRGKPTVVNFWATWCGYCVLEMPAFERMYKEYGDQVNFLMVDLTDGGRETVAAASAFIREKGYVFPIYFDSDLSAYQTYGIYSIPMTLLVNGDGTLYRNHVGAMDEATLRNYIENLL